MCNLPEREVNMIENALQFGTAVASARKALGLTQRELALAINSGERFIVDLEKGKPTMRLEQVMRVIHVLGGVINIAGLDDHGSFHEELTDGK